MPTIAIGKRLEDFVAHQIATGRYADPSEVVRAALHLMEERERRLKSLHAAIEQGLADIDAGKVHDADEVFDALEAELAAFPEAPHA